MCRGIEKTNSIRIGVVFRCLYLGYSYFVDLVRSCGGETG